MFRSFAAVCLAAGANAAVTVGKSCPDYARAANFDAARYMGTWYEV